MKTHLFFLIIFLFTGLTLTAQEGDMTNQKMARILHDEAKAVEGQTGNWQVSYGNRIIYVITDANANRMRILTPVAEIKKLKKKELLVLLEANYDRALDAKYAIFDEYLMSVYTHPLSQLHKGQLIDAMRQVVTLANNFGTSYTSTDMIFGGGEEN